MRCDGSCCATERLSCDLSVAAATGRLMTVLTEDQIACARIVEKGDPDRFVAAMAAPVAARRVLFPLYAFNVEVARAPWVSAEPMIAQMRLQWWADVLDEIAQGGPVRRHEVASPLADVLAPRHAQRLMALVEARRLDIERAPFDDKAALDAYLDHTAGALAATAADALGPVSQGLVPHIMIWARAAGYVRYLQAVPELEARGKQPLPDGRADSLAAEARAQLAALRKLGGSGGLRGLKNRLGQASGAAVLEFWQTRALLQRVAKEPGCVGDGRLALSDFSRRWRMLLLAR